MRESTARVRAQRAAAMADEGVAEAALDVAQECGDGVGEHEHRGGDEGRRDGGGQGHILVVRGGRWRQGRGAGHVHAVVRALQAHAAQGDQAVGVLRRRGVREAGLQPGQQAARQRARRQVRPNV